MFDYAILKDNVYITRIEAKNKKQALEIASKYFNNITVERIKNNTNETKLWKL